MAAGGVEGRWTTWTDDQGQTHVARIDVPGNEALESRWRSGTMPLRPTPEELQRAIEWTAQNPDWQQEAEQELEDIGGARYQEWDTGTPEQTLDAPPAAPQGPRFYSGQGSRLYVDSKTGNIVQADHAPDAQFWWRLILGYAPSADADMNLSLAEGEPAVIVPSNFPFLSPAEQIRIAGQAINQQYGDATQQAQEGQFLPKLLDLQRQWGVSPPQGFERQWPDEEEPRAAPVGPGPESRFIQPTAEPVQMGLQPIGIRPVIQLAQAPSGQAISPEEGAAIQDVESAESRWRFNYDPTVSPFNQGQWPTEDEQARRQELIRGQVERMKRERPDLYRRLPLLQGSNRGGISRTGGGSDPPVVDHWFTGRPGLTEEDLKGLNKELLKHGMPEEFWQPRNEMKPDIDPGILRWPRWDPGWPQLTLGSPNANTISG